MSIFEKKYKEYDLWYKKNPLVFESELLALQKTVPVTGRGIEIGVGTGRFASALNIKYGIDPSRNMLKLARRRGVLVKRAAGENIPFGENTFDYAVLIFSLCFLKNPLKVFKEIKRILKPGGKLIVGFIDKKSQLGKRYAAENNEYYRNAMFYTAAQTMKLYKTTGFLVTNIYQTIIMMPETIEVIEKPKRGSGSGGFVVITGVSSKK